MQTCQTCTNTQPTKAVRVQGYVRICVKTSRTACFNKETMKKKKCNTVHLGMLKKKSIVSLLQQNEQLGAAPTIV